LSIVFSVPPSVVLFFCPLCCLFGCPFLSEGGTDSTMDKRKGQPKEEQTTQWTKEKDNRSSTENYIENERLNLRTPHQPGMNLYYARYHNLIDRYGLWFHRRP
jgi:hypothetical protein